ncbi:MAG: cysteine desulfurase [Gammaproteobacteria bacterium]|nr:cysteine desulfurase [Gammaproteobacteria bacterium]
MSDPVYLDHAATTPVIPEVAQAMRPYLHEHFGNPASGHVYGRRAAEALDRARGEVAALIGADVGEIVFTGCATEANNLAIRGAARAGLDHGRHLITSAVEHPSVAEPFARLAAEGWEVDVLPVDGTGRVDPAALARVLRADTVLVSVMHANNEVGTVQPVGELARLAHDAGAVFHTDAAQTAGKLEMDVRALGADLMTLAGHKFNAPKGVGALYVRSGIAPEPLLHGGGQERGLRPGTENVPHIVGLGEAARQARAHGAETAARVESLRERLRERLAEAVPGLAVNGHPIERLPGILHVSFPGITGGALLERAAGDVAASTGSACHAGEAGPSGVLGAMGLDAEHAASAVRLSVGVTTTPEEIDRAAWALIDAYRLLE